MNPWLLIAAAGGLLALVASKKAPPAAAALAPAAPATSGAGGPALTATNIQRAYLVAMRTETDPTKLMAFGNALIAYGYPTQGAQLLARAAQVAAQANAGPSTPSIPSLFGSGGLPPDTKVDPVSKYVFSPSQGGLIGRMDNSGNFVPKGGGQAVDPKTGKPVAGTSEFGPSGAGLGKNDINYWVNRYAKATLKVGDVPSKSQVQTAAANAVKYEKNPQNLLTFANILQSYGYGGVGSTSSPAAKVQAKALSEEVQSLVPWVTKFAGTAKVDHDTLMTATTNAKKHGSASDLMAFGALLVGFSDFYLDWSATGTELMMASGQRTVQQAQAAAAKGHHHHA